MYLSLTQSCGHFDSILTLEPLVRNEMQIGKKNTKYKVKYAVVSQKLNRSSLFVNVIFPGAALNISIRNISLVQLFESL